MKSSNQFKLSKRIRLVGKLLGYNTAFNMFGDKKLGQGAFGTVYSSKGSAVKVSHSKGLKALENEIQMLQKTSGIGVAPKLLGSGKGYAAIQKFEGNTLWNTLTRVKQDPVFADYIFRKIVESVGALHRKNIAHRDLHAGNIFITNDYQVKILDYGQALKRSGAAYYEAILGTNNDPSQGALGLVAHSFENTKSYKTYNRILHNTVKTICKLVGADPKIVFTDYADIEGDEEQETIYFDELQKITTLPEGNDQNIISLLYNALDTALKINSKNPKKIRTIVPKTSIASKPSGIVSSINKKYQFPGTIPQASEGGVFSGPESGYPIILHGTEAVIPLDNVKLPPARFIQGQSAVWELEFESVLDHAVYFAGKSPFPKGAKQAEILDWLQDTLGLTFIEIHDHRKKIIDKIRELTPSGWGADAELILKIPRIDPDFEKEIYMESSQTSVYTPGEKFVDDQKEIFDGIVNKAEEALQETSDSIMDAIDEILKADQEKLEKFKQEEAKRLEERIKKIHETDQPNEEPEDEEEDEEEPEGLDDLLNDIAQEKPTQEINEDVLDDLPEGLREALAKHINKKVGQEVIPQQEKTRKSSSVSNNKIYKFLTTGITQIQNKLNSIDASIQEQNNLLRNSIDLSFRAIERVEEQDQILSDKIDALTEAYLNQNNLAKELYDKKEFVKSERGLERFRKASGLETPIDTRNLKDSATGPGLISKVRKFFNTRVGKFLWSLIDKHIPSRLKSILFGINRVAKLPSKIASKISSSVINRVSSRVAPKVATSLVRKGAVKGWEHIALPGVEKAVTSSMDKPVAKAFSSQADNVFIKILKSPKVQNALVKKLGKEGAEKLSVKLAAKLIPGVSTAYGLGEGIARMAMGDIKGGFLSFGSAIPVAGWGFAAVDVLRDIDTTAYTKHIESNLGSIATGKGNQHIAAFFADALGVTEGDYEVGGLTKPGVSMLHGTEAVIPKDQITPVDPMGGILLAATAGYLKNAGPEVNSIAPMIKQVAAPLAKIYDVPNVVVSTPMKGNMSSLSSSFKQFKSKTMDDGLTLAEKDLLNTPNETIFSEMLYKMIDPQGVFLKTIDNLKNKLQNFRNPLIPPGNGPDGGIVGDLQGKIVNPMEEGDMQDYAGAKFGADRPGRPGGHMGRDVMGPPGMKVVSALPGTVIRILDVAQYKDGSGTWSKRIDIDHGNGIVTKYMHVVPNVKEGDQVNAGQKIASVSPEDKISDGSHLHFEIWRNGVAQDPETFLKTAYKLKDIQAGKVPGLSISPSQSSTGPLPTAQGLGKQGIMGNQDFGQTSGVGSKGYLIVPGHSSGGGAPEEKTIVKMLARNAYDNLKAKFPNANVHYLDPDSLFTDDDSGWDKQKAWYKQKEKEGWEILEVHMDASVESGQGKGRGVITSKSELNPVEAHFAKNYGAFDRGFRDLALPNRGGSIFELGNMSPELQRATKNNSVTKQQLDALTAPFERSISSGLNLQSFAPPTQQPRFESLQGSDGNVDTKFLIINQSSPPRINGAVSSSFEMISPNTWRSTSEIDTPTRKLLMRRLGSS